MTIDERAFAKAWEAFNQPRAALIGDFMPRSLRAALEAYEAARAEPERPMWERIDRVIIEWLSDRESKPRVGFDDLRNAIIAELRTPTRSVLQAMTQIIPTWDDDVSLAKWQSAIDAIAKGA